MDAIPRTLVRTQFIPCVDTLGRYLMLPEPLMEYCRQQGLKELDLKVPIPATVALEDWLTVTAAAKALCRGSPGLKLETAKTYVTRACKENRIECRGKGRERRIDPNSFAKWQLEMRDRDLDKEDRT